MRQTHLAFQLIVNGMTARAVAEKAAVCVVSGKFVRIINGILKSNTSFNADSYQIQLVNKAEKK